MPAPPWSKSYRKAVVPPPRSGESRSGRGRTVPKHGEKPVFGQDCAQTEQGGASRRSSEAALRELYPDPESDWNARLKRFLLDSDARFDNFLFQSGRWARELWERFSMFMDRFHVAGWRRWVFVEPFSEGATLGAGGLDVMLALALPAFLETADDDWLKKSELAVTFLDRYGNEIGSRGIRHNDSIPLEDFPDHLIKATLATEDRRFYEHFGIDFPGLFRAM